MSANKSETKKAAKKVATPPVDAPPTDGDIAATPITEVADAPPIDPETILPPPPTDEVATVETEKPAKKNKFKSVEALVEATLYKHLPDATAAAMLNNVVAALEKGEVVTLGALKVSPILVIHRGSSYSGDLVMEILSERVGHSFDVVFNQLIAEHFPQG